MQKTARTPAETPLMRQYLEVKQRFPDAILFFRLGDFYEMFFEDAVYVARTLDLTLTTRDKGREDAVPMCGVPYHSAKGYIGRLLELGHRVAICEQVEDPKQAKGIVKREVVRVVTPGVVLDEEQLEAKVPHFLAAVVEEGGRFGLALLDVTTGDFRATEVDEVSALGEEIVRVEPREVVGEVREAVRARFPACAYTRPSPQVMAAAADPAAALAGLETSGAPGLALRAAAMAYAYARATQPVGALPAFRVLPYQRAQFLVLDDTTKSNLELFETLLGRTKRGSLLGVIDETRTAPGGRLLRNWLAFPLRDRALIGRRQDAIELLVEAQSARDRLRALLAEVYDVERLTGRVKLGVASPRDLAALRASLGQLPELCALLASALAGRLDPPALLIPPKDPLADVAADIAAVLVDDPPALSKDGGYIRRGFSPELDELQGIASGGKAQILAIEARERARTGIASLRIKYNRVFGYYLEVTRSHLKNVPSDYIRKQTLAGAERFVTAELADYEAKVLHADERRVALEQELLSALRSRVAAQAPRLLAVAEQVATLDALAALAEVAHRSGYARPSLLPQGGVLEVEDGRHPVVEQMAAAGGFVPNDTRLDPAGEQILTITGPNMAGKSTVMRQLAVIQILAQMGSFVPAKAARLSVCDRIFTRVGAADNLSRGESTFMVEMRESAHILAHATRDSLVVLDEIGRGTSTYDGLSIAWAVAEFLHDRVGCKTLFATHYHELVGLSATLSRVRTMQVAVKEWKSDIVFLRKLVPGGASRSYGIEVARLAGLPREVLVRAREILAQLERARLGGAVPQLDLFGAPAPAPTAAAPAVQGPTEAEVVIALRQADLDSMTPLEALTLLAELKRRC